MSLSFRTFVGGIFVLSLLLPGCAGGGLKNMFSRDDTAGYRTLEEIEADEAKKAAGDTAVADADAGSDKPRFSPWLPLGRKSTTSTVSDESLAAAKPSEDEVSPKYGKWWQRAFRTRDPYESDPFLAGGDDIAGDDSDRVADSKGTPETLAVSSDVEKAPLKQSETGVAKSKAPASEVVRAAETTKPGSKVIPVRETRIVEEDKKTEDELLVEKFEQRFRKSTLPATEEAEDAEPLIAAGKAKAESTVRDAKSRSQKVSEAKLSELEELLAERRTSAVRSARQKRSAVQSKAASEFDELAKVSDDLVVEAAKKESLARKKTSSAVRSAESKVSGFDRLLMEANGESPAEEPLSATKKTSPVRAVSKTPTPKKTQATDDVHVASAEDLFGEETPTTQKLPARKTRTSAKPSSPRASRDEDGFEWQQTRQEPPRGEMMGTEEVSLTAGHTATSGERVASKSARPVRELAPKSSSFNAVGTSRIGIQEESSPFRIVSDSGTIDELAARSSEDSELAAVPSTGVDKFSGDGFFTQSPVNVAPQPPTNKLVARLSTEPSVQSAPATSGGFQLTGRHWMLLIGGLIVVALLFAPGGRKQLSAGSSPVQG